MAHLVHGGSPSGAAALERGPVRNKAARYAAEFERLAKNRGENGPRWLDALRRSAIARFVELGFPTAREEEWKFTSVAPIAENVFTFADGAGEIPSLSARQIAPFAFGEATGARIVFVNGRHAPRLSRADGLPDQVRVSSLASVLTEREDAVEPYLGRIASHDRFAFGALNTAFLDDGAFVQIPAQAVVEAPIHLLFISTAPLDSSGPVVTGPRVLIVLGENSQAQIIESYAGLDRRVYFTNAVTEILVGEHAVLDHYKLQHESLDSFHVGAMYVRSQRGSTFSSHSFSFGGALVRNEVVAALEGEGVDCTLNGLYVAKGRQLVDNHTAIDHAKAHCGSHEIYKGILGGQARAVFSGKIIVRPDAQKTDAKQTNKALLLSDEAQINTKPQLEIFANDVKCTHGAAIGQLDDDAIFYLRTRGLSFEEARTLLIRAFAGDILNRIRIDALKTRLEEMLVAELGENRR